MDAVVGVVWKSVVGWEGLYEVSSEGDIRRLRSFGVPGGLLRGQIDRRGYRIVMLRAVGRPRRNSSVHRLVTAAFIGPIPAGFEVNHKNGVKTDNRAQNLEYLTHRDNVRHAAAIGLIDRRGEKGPRAKFRTADVMEIRRRYSAGASIPELCRVFNRPNATIWSIVHQKTWAHL